MVKRAALSPGDLWLFEDINKPPEGIKAGGIVWRHIMGHALITVREGEGYILQELEAPWGVHVPNAGDEDVTT